MPVNSRGERVNTHKKNKKNKKNNKKKGGMGKLY